MKIQSVVLICSLLIASLLLGGCGFDQDPLKGRSKELRNADKPGEKPDRTPIDPRNIIVDAPTVVTFKEGKANDFTVGVRVLIPGYDKIQVMATNLDEFIGATFDSTTGLFEWTPPRGTVIDDFDRDMKLNLAVEVTSSDENKKGVITSVSTVNVRVDKRPYTPTITSLEGPTISVREKDRLDFIIHVSDEDRTGPSGKAPSLVFLQSGRAAVSIGHIIKTVSVSYDANKKNWIFECRGVLAGEYTSSQTTIGFDVMPVSAFGRVGPSVGYTISVYTALKPLLHTWGKVSQFEPKVERVVPFVVYNPQGEGVLELDLNSVTIPDGSTLECVVGNAASVLNCKFTYTPEGEVGRISDKSVAFKVITRNTFRSDTASISTPFNLQFKVGRL